MLRFPLYPTYNTYVLLVYASSWPVSTDLKQHPHARPLDQNVWRCALPSMLDMWFRKSLAIIIIHFLRSTP